MFTEKQAFYSNILTSRDKIIQDKEEEIKILREKLKFKFDKYEKMEQNEILESQYNKIQEFMYGSIRGPTKKNNSLDKQKMKALQNIIEEGNKFKMIVSDLIDHNKNNRISEIQECLDKISNETNNINM